MKTQTTTLATLLLLAVTAGCEQKPASRPDATPAPKAEAAPPKSDAMFPLGTGESYYGGPLATNPLAWQTPGGPVVYLALVTTGKDEKGRERGVLRARYDAAGGTAKSQDLQSFTIDPGIEHGAELKPVGDGRVLFRFGEADAGPTGRNAAVLAWDADRERVRVVKRWHGDPTDTEPSWLVTGVYTPTPGAVTACGQVVARIVACGKDPAFREALFRNAPEAERADMEAHFGTHLVDWKKPAEVKAQCARWGSDAYVDTHFAEPTRLARLAVDTKMTCEYFGREIDDEGGMPRSSVDATP